MDPSVAPPVASDTANTTIHTTPPGASGAASVRLRPLPEEAAPEPLSTDGDVGICAGRFRIEGRLGAGGMGEVYRAADDSLGRAVAVKVLRPDHTDRPDLRRRFLDEAQLTGQLQHPGVPPVFELGDLPDGRPYFAMKLVRGQTFDALLAARPDLAHDRDRLLTVFEQVCQAVGYAHARGVIHRDLKPANIMVGRFGEVQVMDWGLAKVLDARADTRPADAATPAASTFALPPTDPDSDGATAAGTVLGTPAYMPPEQALGEIDLLDERSDVFGLGAILCVALTGHPPYRGNDPLRKARRADLEDALVRLDACGADAELIALAKACLSAEPWKRPKDGGAIAGSVAAHRAGVQERLRKAEVDAAASAARAVEERKRRRLVVVGAAATLLMVVVGGAGLAWWWQGYEANGQAIALALDDAEQAIGKQQWRDAKLGLERADGRLAGGGHDALRRRAEVVRGDLTLVDAVDEARLAGATVLGEKGGLDRQQTVNGYRGALGAYGLRPEETDPKDAVTRLAGSAVRDSVLAALADWERLTGDIPFAAPVTSDVAERDWLAKVLDGWADVSGDASEKEWREALARKDVRALLWLAAAPRVANLPPADLDRMAETLNSLGAWQAAARLLRMGLVRHPGDFWLHAHFHRQFTTVNTPPWEDQTEQLVHLTAAVALRPDSPMAHFNLGAVPQPLRGNRAAEAEYREALRLRPDFGIAHHFLGLALTEQDRHREAETEYREAMRLLPDYTPARYGLCRNLIQQRRFTEAEAECREYLRLKPTHNVQYLLVEALSNQGRHKEAETVSRELLRMTPNSSSVHQSLGEALNRQGRYPEAEAELREALRLYPKDLNTRNILATFLNARGRPKEAEAVSREGVQLTADDPNAHFQLGNRLFDQGRYKEAETAYREAIRLLPTFVTSHSNLGNALSHQGRHKEAEAAYRQAIRLEPEYHLPHHNLGCDLNVQGRHREAESELREAIRLKPDFPNAHYILGSVLNSQGRFTEAAAAFRRGHELGSRQPGWRYPSAEMLRQAERFAALDARLPELRSGKSRPVTSAEALEVVALCQLPCRKLHAAAARFAADAFAAEPAVAEDLAKAVRYNAACSAALAGCGKGEDAGGLDDEERARLRGQAREWLMADLAAWRKRLEGGKAEDRKLVQGQMEHWQKDEDFAGVRGDEALAKLPEGERAAWRKLWADVDGLLAQARKAK